MNKALVGTLLVTCVAVGCSKEKNVEPSAAVKKAAVKKAAVKKAAVISSPEPDNACTLAQGEHAQPPSLTFQNGLKVEGKAYAGTTDATIEKDAPTANAGAEPNIIQKGGKNPRHGLVRWDLSSLPATTTIKGACMAVFVEDPSAQSYAAQELLRDWSEAHVTWASATTAAAWQAPGAWGAEDVGPEVSAIPRKVSGLQTVALPISLVQKWIKEKSTNHGLLLANDRSYDGLTLSSANSPTAGQRPTLLIWK